ncbi:MAG TPA: hypothetical protein VFT15_12575 [Chitinophagaceae bacterium]|nr:hypothetical protein [Chitinophagaceae bacterium]
MKRISKPTNLNLFNLLLPVVAECNDNYQSKSVQTTNSNSTMKEDALTSWKDELLERSTILCKSR